MESFYGELSYPKRVSSSFRSPRVSFILAAHMLKKRRMKKSIFREWVEVEALKGRRAGKKSERIVLPPENDDAKKEGQRTRQRTHSIQEKSFSTRNKMESQRMQEETLCKKKKNSIPSQRSRSSVHSKRDWHLTKGEMLTPSLCSRRHDDAGIPIILLRGDFA